MKIISKKLTYKEAVLKSGYTTSQLTKFVFNKRHNGSNFKTCGRSGILDAISDLFILKKYKNNTNNFDSKEFRTDLKASILAEAQRTFIRRTSIQDIKETYKEPSVWTLNRYFKTITNKLILANN